MRKIINKWFISIPIKAEHITVYKVVSDGGEYTKNNKLKSHPSNLTS